MFGENGGEVGGGYQRRLDCAPYSPLRVDTQLAPTDKTPVGSRGRGFGACGSQREASCVNSITVFITVKGSTGRKCRVYWIKLEYKVNDMQAGNPAKPR